MKYTVIKPFMDLQDKNHAYNVGDAYPHIGAKASDKRIAELASYSNKQGTPLIKAVKDEVAAETEEQPKESKKRSRKNA